MVTQNALIIRSGDLAYDLTGRHLEVLVLPLSYPEIGTFKEEQLIYGCYPAVIKSSEKSILLRQIYQNYIAKDIIDDFKGQQTRCNAETCYINSA